MLPPSLPGPSPCTAFFSGGLEGLHIPAICVGGQQATIQLVPVQIRCTTSDLQAKHLGPLKTRCFQTKRDGPGPQGYPF